MQKQLMVGGTGGWEVGWFVVCWNKLKKKNSGGKSYMGKFVLRFLVKVIIIFMLPVHAGRNLCTFASTGRLGDRPSGSVTVCES